MAGRSRIEWTEATWNPVTGCSKVSPGCAHCYAETFAERWRGVPGHPYEQGFDLRLWPERLEVPLRWRRPRVVFVNSMSDLFHEDIPDEYVAEVFDVMIRAKQHTFQILTKRHERLVELAPQLPWPRNVWMGVTIENRRCLDEDVAFFFKQWGGQRPKSGGRELDARTWDAMPTPRIRELIAAV